MQGPGFPGPLYDAKGNKMSLFDQFETDTAKEIEGVPREIRAEQRRHGSDVLLFRMGKANKKTEGA